MTNHSRHRFIFGHRVIGGLILCLFAFGISMPAEAQKRKKKVDEKVYLDHAGELRYDEFKMPGVQIVKGKVRFHYQDTKLDCDSAYFNQSQNTFEAFGHVVMRKQGGITLTCDRAKYDSNTEYFQARKNVVLKQPGRSLYCDSLDYNKGTEYANYFGEKGGRLVTGKNTVVSKRGEYYLNTHDAHFYDDVVMTSPKYKIETPTLVYNTETEIAHVSGSSVITGKKGEVIHTNDGYYNSKTDNMELTGWSTVNTKERDIEGDHIKYNNVTGESEGNGRVKIVDKVKDRTITGDHIVYNEKSRKGNGEGNVLFVDRKNKNSLKAEYFDYTDSLAIAYGKPVVKDYSQKDTLYMHSDTIRMRSYFVDTDSMYRKVYAYHNVRVYRKDIQAVCGLAVGNSKDSCLTMYLDPIVWSGERQLLGDSIKAYMNDSTVREAFVFGRCLSVEKIRDGEHYNQIASKFMHAFFTEGKLRRSDAIGSVMTIYYPEDDKDSTLIGLNYLETDTMRMFVSPMRKMEKIWASKSKGTTYPMTQIPADKKKLPNFAWFDYMRPLDPDDIYRIVTKKDGVALKRERAIMPPPRQKIHME